MLYEVRYQYRNILTSKGQGSVDQVRVYNENFFKDLSGYRLEWNVTADGEQILSGNVDDLKVAPQDTVSLSLGFSREDIVRACASSLSDKDIYLNVQYILKAADGLLPQGSMVAYDQICLQKGTPVEICGMKGAGLPELAETGEAAVFSGLKTVPGTTGERESSWSAVFDKSTGALKSFILNGSPMLSEPLMPNFNRALVENDMGASFQKKFHIWRNPSFIVKTFSVEKASDCYVVRVEYEPIEGAATVIMTYSVFKDGTISGVEAMKDAGKLSSAPDMFRFGMTFAMPGDYSTVDFYGKGPWENYCDRNSGATIGHYVQSVNDQYHYGYVRTQESGTKTELRYFKVLSADGTGVEITSDAGFSASALPFSIKDLDSVVAMGSDERNPKNGQYGAATHSLELLPKAHLIDRVNGTTYVCFDLKQMGVGGIQTWGAWPLEQYRIHAAEREFHFVLHPVE
jgi:beta-galactosidase